MGIYQSTIYAPSRHISAIRLVPRLGIITKFSRGGSRMKVTRNNGKFKQLDVMTMMLFLAQNPQERNAIIDMCKRNGIKQKEYQQKLKNNGH